MSLSVVHHVTKPLDADLRVTVSRQVSRGYVWAFAAFAATSAALFATAFVRGFAAGTELEPWEVAGGLALAAVFVGSGVVGAAVHARPFVEEATVRAGSLVVVRSRYRSRRAFVGSLAEGLRVQLRDPLGSSGELLFSIPGRAVSFGHVLPHATLSSIRDQIEAALADAV